MLDSMPNNFDVAQIRVEAGSGGRGAVSFRKEKYVPRGGPDGGDGGAGGSVIIRGEAALSHLLSYQHRKFYRAANGKAGGGQKKQGRAGEDLVLKVPVGTRVWELKGDGRTLVADIDCAGKEVVVARGGGGGWGNVHFATPTNQVPWLAQSGEPGEAKNLLLELELIADVGLIGLPNVGKSSLLARISRSNPKIAPYPFTTTSPVLGVVDTGKRRLVIAEIPGLIEGAHKGRGLGHHFLRHVMRNRVLVHLVDGAASFPEKEVEIIDNELREFDEALAKKPKLVVVNKIDLPEVCIKRGEIAKRFRALDVEPLFISALTGEGVPELLWRIEKRLEDVSEEPMGEGEEEVPILRPVPRRLHAEVSEDNGIFIIKDPVLERVIAGSDWQDAEVRRQVRLLTERRGIGTLLEKAGARAGSRVRCGTAEWEW